MQNGSESNLEIPCARCHQRYPKSAMVYGLPSQGFRPYWLCGECYAKRARMKMSAGAGIVAVAIIIVGVWALVHS
jgi:hypothetical protein